MFHVKQVVAGAAFHLKFYVELSGPSFDLFLGYTGYRPLNVPRGTSQQEKLFAESKCR
jgi:hypothetical protein